MNWVEILQVVGPIALGLAGILSGYGIARHQSKSAAEAEVRARIFVASADLLAVSQQTLFYLTSWRTSRTNNWEVPVMTMDPESVLSRANLSAGACSLYGGEIEDAGLRLIPCLTGALLLFEFDGTLEESDKIHAELLSAVAAFAVAARHASGASLTVAKRRKKKEKKKKKEKNGSL